MTDTTKKPRSPGMVAGILRAMAEGYTELHTWDDLDAEVCRQAADQLAALEEAQPAATADLTRQLSDARARILELEARVDTVCEVGSDYRRRFEAAERELAATTTARDIAVELGATYAAQLDEARAEIRVSDQLLTHRQQLLDAIPECSAHGPCVLMRCG